MLVHARIALPCVTSPWNLRHFLCYRPPTPKPTTQTLHLVIDVLSFQELKIFSYTTKVRWRILQNLSWTCLGHIWLQRCEIIFCLKKRKCFKIIKMCRYFRNAILITVWRNNNRYIFFYIVNYVHYKLVCALE